MQMQLTKEDIKEINNESPNSEQGIYTQPYGIPVSVKEPVIYMRWMSGGITGGSCWGTKHHPRTPDDKPKFKVLDLVLKRLKPDVSFLDFREIEELIRTNEYGENEYYGNSTDYKIEYIILSELYEKINELNNK